MTTAAVAGGPGPSPALSIPRVPFARLVRVELRKAYDTRAGMWLLIAIGGLTLVATVLFLIFGHDNELTFTNFVQVAATPQGFLLPVFAILAITSEWSQRTGLTTFTLEPNRGRALGAKVVAILVMGLIAAALLYAIAAVCTLIGTARTDVVPARWDYGLEGFASGLTLQTLGLMGGVAFGTILLNSAAAIVLNYILPLISGIVFNVIPALESAKYWIDAGTAQQPLSDHTANAHEWAQVAVTSLWWVWIPLVVGVVRVLRTEIKSA
jgi:ABC-type transport system involved in multi-copper enzyme maturation permease subunit